MTQYYHTDVLGSVKAITDGGQNPIATYNYDAWGNVTSETGSASNKYTFTSRQDETGETGLLYYRARYYDPTIGRFISQDPFTGGPDDARIGYSNNIFEQIHGAITLYTSFRQPHRFNRYLYCENNPVSFIDPLGLTSIFPTPGLSERIPIDDTRTRIITLIDPPERRVISTPIDQVTGTSYITHIEQTQRRPLGDPCQISTIRHSIYGV